jgi:phosphatidate phosphatase APP1
MALRDLLGSSAGRDATSVLLNEFLDLHPRLRFVLLGDSGEHDPKIYADLVRAYPGRVLAVYIREVRLDPGDGRVEEVSSAWAPDVPFVLAPDSDTMRRHAVSIGLV